MGESDPRTGAPASRRHGMLETVASVQTMTPLGPPRIEASVLGDDAVVLGALATGLATARQIVLDTALGPHLAARPSATTR
jgi:hypothetical protein